MLPFSFMAGSVISSRSVALCVVLMVGVVMFCDACGVVGGVVLLWFAAFLYVACWILVVFVLMCLSFFGVACLVWCLCCVDVFRVVECMCGLCGLVSVLS